MHLDLDTGDNIDLKHGTSSQTQKEKKLFLVPCVICSVTDRDPRRTNVE